MSYPSWVKTSIEMFSGIYETGVKQGTNCADFTMQHRHALAMLQLVAVHKCACAFGFAHQVPTAAECLLMHGEVSAILYLE